LNFYPGFELKNEGGSVKLTIIVIDFSSCCFHYVDMAN